MRFFYILALLLVSSLVYVYGEKTLEVQGIGASSTVSDKDQHSTTTEPSGQILKQLTENQALFESVQTQLQASLKQKKPEIPDTKPPLSEDDKSAQSSPIFTPGGAPRPLPQKKPPVRSSATDNKKDSDKDKPDSDQNNTTDDNTNSPSDSGIGSSLPDNNNYNNPSYPPSSSSTGSTTLKATFKPSGDAFKYTIKEAGENPFAGVADNHLKLTVNGSVYTKIKLCNADDYTACEAEAHALPWTISTEPDKVGYLKQVIDKLTLKVPSISAQLTKKDGSTQNIQFLFYKSSLCTKDGDNLSCTIPKSGASFEINKT